MFSIDIPPLTGLLALPDTGIRVSYGYIAGEQESYAWKENMWHKEKKGG